MSGGIARRILEAILLACAFTGQASAQLQPGCQPDGTRVLAHRWDSVLAMGWELRQNCAHPEWPAHLAAISPDVAAVKAGGGRVIQAAMAQSLQPLVVHAGDTVRLWMQDRTVRIEISGVAERSARSGEQVTVRVTQQSDDGLTVQRIAGIARGPGDVEMDQ